MLVVPRQGRVMALKAFLAQDLVLRLFVNDHEPGEPDTEADYREADFPGYQPKALRGHGWELAEAGPAAAGYPAQAFVRATSGRPQDVYGYYLTHWPTGRLAWAERFPDGPYPVSNMNDSITVEPRIEQEG